MNKAHTYTREEVLRCGKFISIDPHTFTIHMLYGKSTHNWYHTDDEGKTYYATTTQTVG
jgi:hypothetical protein